MIAKHFFVTVVQLPCASRTDHGWHGFLPEPVFFPEPCSAESLDLTRRK
jgi:hypothetical protein